MEEALKTWIGLWLAIAAIASAAPSAATADELVQEPPGASAPELPNRFMIRGGYGYVFSASTNLTLNGSHTVGTNLDYEFTLGGDREDTFWRIDASFHLTPRHAFFFSYYDVTRTGQRVLARDVTIEDKTFVANATAKSELDIALYRLYYNYSFYLSEKVDLALSAGLYIADIKFKLSGDLSCSGSGCGPGTTLAATSVREKVFVPMPSLGVQFNYNILPRLQAQTRFDWLYLEASDLRGMLTEVYVGLEYRLFKHFALGAAYDFLNVQARYKANKPGGWGVQNIWNTVFMYGALYF